MTALHIDVIYALAERQLVQDVEVPEGASMWQAVELSGLLESQGLDPDSLVVGMYGRIEKAPREYILKDGDRVEIYRPLVVDPKESRKARVARARAARA